MLQFGLRLGVNGRGQVITTTPRPIPLVRQLLDDPEVAVTTYGHPGNAGNLLSSPQFLGQ
jgi:phage terminase large subunit-like protein